MSSLRTLVGGILIVSVVVTPLWGQNLVTNGDFTAGSTGWSPWILKDNQSDFDASVVSQQMVITGSDIDGGVYRQFNTGGIGNVVTVTGYWRSGPTLANAMFAEVWIINADRAPTDGVDETNGVNNALLMFRNDTFDGRGAWDGPIPRNTPVAYRISFVATASKATILLRAGNTGPSTPTGVTFDDIDVRSVPPTGVIGAMPAGFSTRSHTFFFTNAVSIAQSPTSKNIYVVSYEGTASNTKLVRVNVGGGSITTTTINGLGSLCDFAQGMTFDPSGNLYISTQYGKVLKGTDTDGDPAVDAFSFAQILDMPDNQIGTFHGVGGVAVGPDNKLYINSGSESHYGYLPDGSPEVFAGRLNARILRCNLDGTGLEVFADGIRNSFDIAFRMDGALFGVENGPNTGCDYAEEFNRLVQNAHYGFPYKYGSDVTGSDSSIACQNTGGGNVLGPPALPGGITPTASWGNYGPDAKPGVGGVGYSNGNVYFGFNPHSSPDGIDFYEPSLMDPVAPKFPAEFHGRAFVARLGQLENVPKVGFDLITLRLYDEQDAFTCNTFITSLARSIDVLCAYNGRVYVIEHNQQTNFPGGSWGTPSRIHEITYTPSESAVIALGTTSITRTARYHAPLSDDTLSVWNDGDGTLVFDVSDDHAWISANPSGGSSSGPGDVQEITISYPGADTLPLGENTGTITVADAGSTFPASNSPVAVSVTINVKTVKYDFDHDGDVDLSDFTFFQACFNGPDQSPTFSECDIADLDGDNDVDVSDFTTFQVCFSGPGGTPALACPLED